MLKAKRCAKEAQNPTALETLLQNLAKAQEEAIAPQRKKARNAQHQTEAETGLVSGDSQVQRQRRIDMEEEATAAAAPPAAYAALEHPPRLGTVEHSKKKDSPTRNIKKRGGG